MHFGPSRQRYKFIPARPVERMERTSPTRHGIEVPRLKRVCHQSTREGKSWTRLLPSVWIWQSRSFKCAVDPAGRTVLRKGVRRERLLALLAQFPCCQVGMEARSGAQHWARELIKLGHEPPIMESDCKLAETQGFETTPPKGAKGKRRGK